MSYEVLEDRFYRSTERTISATRIEDKYVFQANNDDLSLIKQLSDADQLRLYNLVTIDGMLDPNQQ